MIRIIEGLAFVGLATGLHVGVWTMAPTTQGASAAGGAGHDKMTLAAAPPQYQALAQTWQAAPKTVEIPNLNAPTRVLANPINKPASAQPGLTLPPAAVLTPVVPAALPNIQPAPQRPVLTVPDAPAQLQNPDPATAQPTLPDRDAAPIQPMLTPPPAAPLADTAPQKPPKPEKPAAKSKTTKAPSVAAPAAQASGGGQAQKKSVGQAGKDKTQSASVTTRNALKSKWGKRILRKVHRRMIAPRDQTASGGARVELTVNRSGELTGLRLIKSSGDAAIDKAALNAVKRAGRFPPAPAALTKSSFVFTLTLNFKY